VEDDKPWVFESTDQIEQAINFCFMLVAERVRGSKSGGLAIHIGVSRSLMGHVSMRGPFQIAQISLHQSAEAGVVKHLYARAAELTSLDGVIEWLSDLLEHGRAQDWPRTITTRDRVSYCTPGFRMLDERMRKHEELLALRDKPPST